MMNYFDNAATTAVSPSVMKSMLPFYAIDYGNPSSIHTYGRMVRRAIEDAREQVAHAIGASPEEIYFTSGGSESDNWAVKGAAFASPRRKIIISEIEHPAVFRSCDWLERFGYQVERIPVDNDGFVKLDQAKAMIDGDTCLVSVMTANNEIGTIEPISKIAEIAKEHGALMHTDAVQAVGAISINVDQLGVDMLSMSGHKLHAPKGIGALYVRRGTKIESLIHGGGQEQGKRSGTENVPGIVGLGAAIAEACETMSERTKRMTKLKRILIESLNSNGVKYKINGTLDAYSRLPNNLNISFPRAVERNIPMMLDYYGFEVSSGSACSSGKSKPSHVLTAIGCTHAETETSVRITLGDDATEEHMIRLGEILAKCGGETI